jgi:opacity protein-like surface antigen
MKKLLLSLPLIIIFNFLILSQEKKENTEENAFIPAIKSGSMGLMFSFNGLYLTTNTYNGGIGAKYLTGDNIAFRGVLAINYTSSNTPEKDALIPEIETSSSGFGISIDCSYYLKRGRISPFLGSGIGFSTSSSEVKQGNYSQKNYEKGNTFSFYFLGGVEFFILKELSLSAEYRLTLNSYSPKENEVQVAGQKIQTAPGTSTLDISTGSIGLLTVSFYF